MYTNVWCQYVVAKPPPPHRALTVHYWLTLLMNTPRSTGYGPGGEGHVIYKNNCKNTCGWIRVLNGCYHAEVSPIKRETEPT